jgi:FAD-dependent urate hydroxylase
MPADMRLRSDWDETNLSAPGDRGSIDAWARAAGEPREEPIPLQKFLRYADWFRETLVPDTDASNVVQLERGGGAFRVTTEAGDEADAGVVVVAVGVTPFAYAPPPFDQAMGDGVSFAIDRQDYEPYRGRRVVVVGGGQGGLEAAALARRAGAEVEIIIRSELRWFTDREPYKPRGRLRQRVYRIAYPVVGYGPPPLNRLALHPDAFAALPGPARRAVARRILRAGGSPWVRSQIEGEVAVTEGTSVQGLERTDAGLRLTLSDGTRREAAAVVVSAGFRFALDRLTFLSPALKGRRRGAGGLARARPLLPIERPEPAVRRLRGRAPLRLPLPRLPIRPQGHRSRLHGTHVAHALDDQGRQLAATTPSQVAGSRGRVAPGRAQPCPTRCCGGGRPTREGESTG